jgi:4-aminobutyrate aminotransferase-like enzyme
VIIDEQLDRHAARVGAELLAALREIAPRHPFIKEVRGAGLLIGVDLTLDRAGCEKLFHACLSRGLLTMGYTPRVRINPPLVITREQALDGVARFDSACLELH